MRKRSIDLGDYRFHSFNIMRNFTFKFYMKDFDSIYLENIFGQVYLYDILAGYFGPPYKLYRSNLTINS